MTTDLYPVTLGKSGLALSPEEVLAEARRQSLTRDNPLLADLPAWFIGLRDHQRIAVREILTAYEEGAECVVLDAPTGSGKTLIGETVRRLVNGVASSCAGNQQATYICSSKALQDQFIRDYPYAKVLKGRSNYATELYPERFTVRNDSLSAADCTKTPGEPDSCLWCTSTSGCPYEQAKSSALRSELAVLNTSYFLSECNGPGRFSRGGFVIADEADVLESELLSYVEVRISERRLKSYGLGVPKYVTKEGSWREWAEDAYEKVRAQPPRRSTGNDLLDTRARKHHDILLAKIGGLKEGLAGERFIYTGDKVSVAFKPVTVDFLGREKLWRHGEKWLLMSATVISADELLESLGFEGEYRLVKVPSTFKPENRKVVIAPVANMIYREKEVEWPRLANGVINVINQHPDDRILVHSVSYALTEYLRSAIVNAQRNGLIPSQVSKAGIGVLGVDRNDSMERLRSFEGGESCSRHFDASESLRTSGVLHNLQGTDHPGNGNRPSLPCTELCQPGPPGDGDAVRKQTTSDARDDSLLSGPRIHPGKYAGLRRQETMPRMPETARPRAVFSYASGNTKERAVTQYLSTPGAILVAPSLDRGIDLPGEACRVQVVCKVPYLNLKDKQVAARRYTKGGSLWYNIQAIRTIIQACGRGVRSESDWCVTYVLDRQFVDNLWSSSRRLFPEWFKKGLVWKVRGL